MKRIAVSCVLLILAAVAWSLSATASLPEDVRATLIVVEKKKHLMTLYSSNAVLHVYHVALGRGDGSAKQREGDNRTPEGHYVIDAKNEHSAFYKSMHISYPSPENIVRARSQGVSPGGAVMIHGLRNDLKWLGPLHRLKDWTRGCIAVTDSEMDELWQMVNVGTPIEIKQ
ncbi:MAG: L,D-transpeptidase family protein [Steroidobacter sp.]